MKIFYFIIIRIYFILIYFASFFNAKAKKMIEGRKNWATQLKNKVETGSDYIWVHCASLGEFEQARPVIELIKKNKNDKKIILSFFSPSGYEIRKNYKFADIVCYLPFDSKKNAKTFINIVKPGYAIFVKYEFWYYYINELSKQKIDVYLISAVFRKSQIFFKKYGNFYLKILKKYKTIFLQDEKSKQILEKFGITNSIVCGDTRIDRVVEIAREDYNNKHLDDFSKNGFTLIAGSTYLHDEKILYKLFEKAGFDLKLIIAPHEVGEENISRLQKLFKERTVRLSEVKSVPTEKTDVVIVDSIGLLSRIYRYADIVYIGGGFGKGIHNILEAVAYGVPIAFGPNHKKFNEAIELINYNVAFEINNHKDLMFFIDKFRFKQDLLLMCKENAQNFIYKSKGASNFIYKNFK